MYMCVSVCDAYYIFEYVIHFVQNDESYRCFINHDTYLKDTHTHTHTYMWNTHTHIYIYMCGTHTHTHTYIYMCVCVCVCV